MEFNMLIKGLALNPLCKTSEPDFTKIKVLEALEKKILN